MKRPDRRRTARLSDGRLLAWSEWGQESAAPVVFCTGAGMSGWLGFGTDELGRLGLRLVAFDRPGLGASSAHPGKTIESWADDIRELGLRNARTVGFSQGAPFALALAGRGLVKSAALVAAQDELAHPRMRPLLHPDVLRMVEAVERDAACFEQQFAAMATAEGLWRLILGMSSGPDREFYGEEAFSAAFRRSLEEGFAQGAAGYARDLANALRRWPVQPEEVNVPVDLWYGRGDAGTVHSPDFGVTLEQRLPKGQLRVEAGEGGSILWTRSREILEQLAG